MKQKLATVIKLNPKVQTYSEDQIIVQNLNQILIEVVKQHGAKTTLQGVQDMIQSIAKQVRDEKNLPISKRNKAVSNG